MRIGHNLPSLVAKNAISRSNDATDNSAKKLSTGKRVNTAADDAAGMAIINKFKTQVKGLNMADRNASDAISLIQTAEGGLSEMHNMLQRMRELAVQGANDTLTTADRGKIQEEADQLIQELDKTAGKIQFNTKPLLEGGEWDGHAPNHRYLPLTLTFQVGASKEDGQNGMELSASIGNMRAWDIGFAKLAKPEVAEDLRHVFGADTFDASWNVLTYGEPGDMSVKDYMAAYVSNGNYPNVSYSNGTYIVSQNIQGSTGNLSVPVGSYSTGDFLALNNSSLYKGGAYSTRAGCTDAIKMVDDAINQVSDVRSNLGAVQNRLEHTVSAIRVSVENATTALSRVEDADMAATMTEYSTTNVLVQAGISMLAQSNQRPQQVLQLLQ